MKPQATASMVALALLLAAGVAAAFGQATFKVPFPIQAGDKKLAAGDYSVAMVADGQLVLRHIATGKESALAVIDRIASPKPPMTAPQLVFDEVGDFMPSYTEYVTVYVLSEVWFPGEDGFRVHVTKGAHKTKTVVGEAVKK
jgi:hypothetical protein